MEDTKWHFPRGHVMWNHWLKMPLSIISCTSSNHWHAKSITIMHCSTLPFIISRISKSFITVLCWRDESLTISLRKLNLIFFIVIVPPFSGVAHQWSLMIRNTSRNKLQRENSYLQTPASLFLVWRFDLYPKVFLERKTLGINVETSDKGRNVWDKGRNVLTFIN